MLADRKILDRTELKKIVNSLQAEAKRIVFTNGCFDIIHIGHLDLFEKARAFGDILIVGLNTDSSVRRLKGQNRPVIPELDRARLLAALEVVDFVVLFDEDTPLEILQYLQPDVLVKGGDYKRHEVIGQDIVPDVKIVPFMEGKSTTSVIERIRSDHE